MQADNRTITTPAVTLNPRRHISTDCCNLPITWLPKLNDYDYRRVLVRRRRRSSRGRASSPAQTTPGSQDQGWGVFEAGQDYRLRWWCSKGSVYVCLVHPTSLQSNHHCQQRLPLNRHQVPNRHPPTLPPLLRRVLLQTIMPTLTKSTFLSTTMLRKPQPAHPRATPRICPKHSSAR